MDTVVKIIGIVLVAIAIIFLIKPDIMKHLIEFFKKGSRIYLAALIRLALAVVFLLSARECDLTWVIVVFGVIFLIAGLLIFMLGAEKTRRFLEWYQKQSLVLLRVIAVIPLAMGAIIIYAA
jgi:ABC-type bacteriocin/lantibiotic exporter with double-glycine peptidase domain